MRAVLLSDVQSYPGLREFETVNHNFIIAPSRIPHTECSAIALLQADLSLLGSLMLMLRVSTTGSLCGCGSGLS
jgi:hypothetical protein